MARVTTQRALDLLIAVALAIAILVALHGAVRVDIGPARFSAREVWRPLVACIALIAIRVVSSRRATSEQITSTVCRVGFLALFGAIAGTWVLFLVTSCGGADSYGYVSTSRLLRSVELSQPDPIAAHLPVPDPMNRVAPVGYVAAADGHSIAPGYPLGLPFVMALFGALFGNGAEFYVSPLFAVLATVAAFGVARSFSDWLGASLCALLVAVTPIFVHQAIQPMSDVAATFWTLLAIWLLVRGDRSHVWCLAAGIAAGMAFITRPPLISAIAVMAILVFCLHGRRSAAMFAAAFAPFLVFQGWLHWRLYGSVLGSGYGAASHLFVIERLPGNLVTYFKWLNYSVSPFFLLVLALGAFVCDSRRWWAAAVAVFLGVGAPYLLYFTYNDWQDTRFLLPGIAVAMIACGVTIRMMVARWTPRAAAPVIVLLVACVAAAGSYRFLAGHHTFALARIEARYPRVGSWIARWTPPQTVVFAFLHSGSIRFYADRRTVRWDQMTAEELGASVAALSARGWSTWAVVDGPDEAAAFWPRVHAAAATLVVEPKERVAGVDIVALHPRR